MARVFTKTQKEALAVVEGKEASGLHGDHVTPAVKGGLTDVANGQLLTPKANLQKTSFQFRPREWQQKYFDKWSQRRSSNFLLVAIPGGGKTFAALETARRWLRARRDRRLFVLCPTDNLKKQWRKDAAKFGIQLKSKGDASLGGEFDGIIRTYQTLSNSEVYRAFCSRSETMLIADEIHHCGDEKPWGHGLKHSFEPCAERLLLSGTPWQSDGSRIPFINYTSDGYPIADFPYDYPFALKDGVVRYLAFDYRGGQAEYDSGLTATINSNVSDEAASKALRGVLSPSGDYVENRIIASHTKLIEIRRFTPDAAALALCIDTDHANAVAKRIRQLTGCKPSVIVSDSEAANDSVEAFRESGTEWLVAVRQVSEGTDVKRLQVLCWLTNTTTELFFRQAIGRVSRVRDNEAISEGYVFLPQDPRLIRHAENIENLQAQALREVDREVSESDVRDRQPSDGPRVISTKATEHETLFVGNSKVDAEMHAVIKAVAEEAGISLQQAAIAVKAANSFDSRQIPAPMQTVELEAEKEKIRSKLKARVNNLYYKRNKKSGYNEIHIEFNNGVPQEHMTLEQLRDKLHRIEEAIRNECH